MPRLGRSSDGGRGNGGVCGGSGSISGRGSGSGIDSELTVAGAGAGSVVDGQCHPLSTEPVGRVRSSPPTVPFPARQGRQPVTRAAGSTSRSGTHKTGRNSDVDCVKAALLKLCVEWS